MTAHCTLCPVECGADREERAGACGGGKYARVVKYGLHPYEEPCISVGKGSGTLFFGGCALRCVFCQNYEISHAAAGEETDAKGLAAAFRALEEMGAANINLVTASHYIPQLLEAFRLYRPKIPVVYNTHSYEKEEALRAIDPYIDVYLPDLKFCDGRIARRYTGRADYFDYAFPAVAFMARRKTEFEGEKMVRGCIVRHLVLPLCTDDSVAIVEKFARLDTDARFSLMGQYLPCGEADAFPELRRRITPREYKKVLRALLDALPAERIFAQELSSADEKFIPDFAPNGKKLF